MVLHGLCQVGGALLVHEHRGQRQGVVAVPGAEQSFVTPPRDGVAGDGLPAAGEVRLGDQLVVLAGVEVLVPHPDIARVHAPPALGTGVEREGDAAHLGEEQESEIELFTVLALKMFRLDNKLVHANGMAGLPVIIFIPGLPGTYTDPGGPQP